MLGWLLVSTVDWVNSRHNNKSEKQNKIKKKNYVIF